MHKVNGSSAGFTLVEILVVLVLVGLIGGLVAPSVMKQFSAGKADAAVAQIARLGIDLDLYRLNNGSYPAGLESLIDRPPDAPNWNGPYAKRKSLVDPWGRSLQYRLPGEHGEYDLFTLGADGVAGGDGRNRDVGNWDL